MNQKNSDNSTDQKTPKEIQLTHELKGHMLNQRQAFSPDDASLVFDYRNDDSKIGENASIGILNIHKQESRPVYNLENQSSFGPGVGAGSFHPKKNQLVFIHGLKNASESRPYTFTRRFAMLLDLDDPKNSGPLEARDVEPPFTKGALRGGSHAYSFSKDGRMVSFTYNDAVLAEEALVNPNVQDLRTVGAFLMNEPVSILGEKDDENFDGKAFSVLLAEVHSQPEPGSDQINKAYEECWVGTCGYTKPDGSIQKNAMAYLGDIFTANGEKITEVFISDIPEVNSEMKASVNAGSKDAFPSLPKGVIQRRLTFTEDEPYPGIQGPRHWLRSSPDGSLIYFYKKDDSGIVQVYAVSPNGGEIKRLTSNTVSPETSFSLSADGKFLAYGIKEKIYIADSRNGDVQMIYSTALDSTSHLSNLNWSNSGYQLAYNRKVADQDSSYFQIFMLDLSDFLSN